MSQSRKTLEDLISRLEDIAEKIQDGNVGLEEAIALYEEGRRIAKECNERLNVIQRKLEIIDPSDIQDRDDDVDSDGDLRDLGRDNPILLA
ncbi:MAG: exodeoxyribonuclease VII small subunit [Chloroherpetonaceae bacterium]|nr:exodeoxyribonuclease VII small subunit [Chloroherpetonaceae bacterium]